MKWSQTLIPTLREDPAEAECISHRLLLRAGFMRRLGAGIYSYLPLGVRVLQRIIAIVRQEMNASGASEVLLPTLQPIGCLTPTGRAAEWGEALFTLADRQQRRHALALAGDEAAIELLAGHVVSYRQLPLLLYQIRSSFRDEPRPRLGLLGSRESIMQEAFSFHLFLVGPGGLDEAHDRMVSAYRRIVERCELDCLTVEAPSGAGVEAPSHELICPAPGGEDVIYQADKGDYAANVAACAVGPRQHSFDGPPTGALERVHTPGCASIEDVCAFFRQELDSALQPQNMLKTLLYLARSGGDEEAPKHALVMAVVRGDHDVNEARLLQAVRQVSAAVERVELATEEMLEEWDERFPVGFIGPHFARSFAFEAVLVDPDAAQGDWFWVTGANEVDHHVRHFNWKRDLLDAGPADAAGPVLVADIRNACDGDPAPGDDGGVLRAARGIHLGELNRVGRTRADAMGFHVLDERQRQQSVIMGRFALQIGRIMAAAVETHHDEDGIIWPVAIAPCDVLITPIKYEGPMKEVADDLERRLGEAGLQALLDDRAERPGPKFMDGDLIGIPIRLTVGPKGLEAESVEFYRRDHSLGRGELVRLKDIVARCRAIAPPPGLP
jgi:prolyl-tRNA synthetase